MKKVLAFLSVQVGVLTPLVAFAQAKSDFGNLGSIFTELLNFTNGTLIPLMFALAILVFFYGIFKYFILGGGDEGNRAQGRQLMLWAIVGFIAMASLYGIIELVRTGLGIGSETDIKLPTAPGGSDSGSAPYMYGDS